MKNNRSLTSKGKSDVFYTPETITKAAIEYFNPTGKIIESAAGEGAFLKYLPYGTSWCEIEKGKDYFDVKESFDYEITNPPFSLIRQFLTHSMTLGHKNIIYIAPLSHFIGFKARVRLMKEYNYGIKEIVYIPQPSTFPQSGFQIGFVHYVKNYSGDTKMTFKEWK